MGFTNAILQDLYALLKTKGTYIGVLTDATTEVAGGTYARVSTTWPTGANGTGTGTAGTIHIPAGTTITHMGIWVAASGGSPIAVEQIVDGGGTPAPLTYNQAGTVLVTPTETVANA